MAPGPGRARSERQRQPRLLRGQRGARPRAPSTARPTSTSATARTTTFITGLDQFGDGDNWNAGGGVKTGRVSPSGGTAAVQLATRSSSATTTPGTIEFYVYDLAADEFSCISCRPNGDPATARRRHRQPPTGGISTSADCPPTSAATCPPTARRRSSHRPNGSSPRTRTASTTPICGTTGTSRRSRAARAPTTPHSSTHPPTATTPSS